MRAWSAARRSVALTFALLAVLAAAAAGDGVVAIQTADPSCHDDSGNIYVDCGNGTVTDNRTGLVWLKHASCAVSGSGELPWSEARRRVATLHDSAFNDCDLNDNSSPGEWRLPSLDEWEAMIADAVTLGCIGMFGPAITSDSGATCWQEGPGNAFTSVEDDFYWAASQPPSAPGQAWIVSLSDGTSALRLKTGVDFVWPVRGGQ